MMMEAWESTYDELSNYYNEHFTMSTVNGTLEDRLALIGLICFLTNSARKKNPDATCWQVINKVIPNAGDKHYNTFLRGLSIICSDFMKNCSKFDSMGFKTSKEIIDKINSIVNLWTPF